MKSYRWVFAVAILILWVALGRGIGFASATNLSRTIAQLPGRISPDLRQAMTGLHSATRLRVIITLTAQANLPAVEDSIKNLPFDQRQHSLEKILQDDAFPSQSGMRARHAQLQATGTVSAVVSYWIFNGFSLTATPVVILELAARPEVASITPDRVYTLADPVLGAISNSSAIASFSSRGPTTCGRTASATLPLVVAPGVSVPVAAPGGLYTILSGTSFSAPEAAGGLALLLSAFPGLSPAAQASALTNTAIDLGTAGPDSTFGFGRVDFLAAYQSLKPAVSTPTPKPVTNGPRRFFVPLIRH